MRTGRDVSSALLILALSLSTAHAVRPRDLRRFTGSPTRVVWVQDQGDGKDVFTEGQNLLLVGFDSESWLGLRPLVREKRNYTSPVFTPDGEHVLVSDLKAFKTITVPWGRGAPRPFSDGLVLDTQRDPATGISWAYIGTSLGRGKGTTVSEVRRFRIDDPRVSERVWNQTAVSASGFLVSRSGRAASGLFPWPAGGLARLPNQSYRQVARGCWTALAPDDSLLLWIFDGAHRNLLMHAPDGRHWKIPINVAKGIDGFEVYHPRWSNHVRYMAMTGPYKIAAGGNRIRGGGKGVEVYIGRFSRKMDTIEDWFRVTDNDRGDFAPDVWVRDGDASMVAGGVIRQAQPPPETVEQPVKTDAWPGNPEGLVFAWENARSANQIRDPRGGEVVRTCKIMEHGRAVYGRHFDMRLAGGAVSAQGVDDALLKACRRSHELTLQAVVTPATLKQGGPARIVSFSNGPAHRNVTLGQEGDRLVLRLRTPRTGLNGVNPETTIARVSAGRPVHVVVTYRPGNLVCYVDGREVVNTRAVTGDFSNWEPMQLLFGNERTRDRPWAGGLERVAIFSRFMGPREVAHVYGLVAPKLADRRPPPPLVVDARLVATVPTPSPESIRPYRRCLANYTYEIVKVVDGKCAEERIVVSHWVIMDGRILTPPRRTGDVTRLVLEPMATHPELESERVMESDEFDLPVYFDMAL